jgi:putative acetyltransferase
VPLTISPEPIDAPDSLRLVGALDDYLNALYDIDDAFLDLAADELSGDRGTFLVVRENGVAVGCGGVRRISAEAAEVRRMFVVPAARGRGIASLILEALEAWAARAGATKVVLETGVRQEAAMRLYEGLGYVEVPGLSPYAVSGQTRCYEKALA